MYRCMTALILIREIRAIRVQKQKTLVMQKTHCDNIYIFPKTKSSWKNLTCISSNSITNGMYLISIDDYFSPRANLITSRAISFAAFGRANVLMFCDKPSNFLPFLTVFIASAISVCSASASGT